MYYILDENKKVKECNNAKEWSAFMGGVYKRRVAKDNLNGSEISTVFLGINHGLDEEHPVLFETMVFGGPLDQEQERCCTWDEAEFQHAQMVERVRNA